MLKIKFFEEGVLQDGKKEMNPVLSSFNEAYLERSRWTQNEIRAEYTIVSGAAA